MRWDSWDHMDLLLLVKKTRPKRMTHIPVYIMRGKKVIQSYSFSNYFLAECCFYHWFTSFHVKIRVSKDLKSNMIYYWFEMSFVSYEFNANVITIGTLIKLQSGELFRWACLLSVSTIDNLFEILNQWGRVEGCILINFCG